MLKVMIVEDDSIMRESLASLLGSEKDIEVIGVCVNAEEALKLLISKRPDVVLVDLGLPGMSGVELIGKVKVMGKGIKSVVMTIYEDGSNVCSAYAAGAVAYLVKTEGIAKIVEVLRTVYDGGGYMSPRIALWASEKLSELAQVTNELEALSKKERAVLIMRSRSNTYKEIGENLGISPGTVKKHLGNCCEKLHVNTLREAIDKAQKSEK